MTAIDRMAWTEPPPVFDTPAEAARFLADNERAVRRLLRGALLADGEYEEPGPDEADMGPVPWYGVLAPEGIMSGDRRKFAPDALRWRDLPLPLSWQKANDSGHDGSVIVGRIDGIERRDGAMHAWGVMDQSPDADEAIRLMANGMLRGVSVDVDDATMSFEYEDGTPMEGGPLDALFGPDPEAEDKGEPVMVVTDGRIAGSTLCAIPAFQEAFVALGSDALVAAAWLGVTLPFDYDPAQARVPRGHGHLSGRWVEMWDLPVPEDNLSHFQNGPSIQPYLISSPDGVFLNQERTSLHKEIAYGTLANLDAHENPTFTFVGGGPASGKTTLLTQVHPELMQGAAVLNADNVKTGFTNPTTGRTVPGLPEYRERVDAGDPMAASFVHEEALYVNDRMLAEAQVNNFDVVLDGSGDSHPDDLAKKIRTAKANGSTVNGLYMTIPTEDAIGRSDQRFLDELGGGGNPRHVPHSAIAASHKLVSEAVGANIDNFDNLEVYDNSGPEGSAPQLIFRKDADGNQEVLDADKWSAFLAKADEPFRPTETAEELQAQVPSETAAQARQEAVHDIPNAAGGEGRAIMHDLLGELPEEWQGDGEKSQRLNDANNAIEAARTARSGTEAAAWLDAARDSLRNLADQEPQGGLRTPPPRDRPGGLPEERFPPGGIAEPPSAAIGPLRTAADRLNDEAAAVRAALGPTIPEGDRPGIAQDLGDLTGLMDPGDHGPHGDLAIDARDALIAELRGEGRRDVAGPLAADLQNEIGNVLDEFPDDAYMEQAEEGMFDILRRIDGPRTDFRGPRLTANEPVGPDGQIAGSDTSFVGLPDLDPSVQMGRGRVDGTGTEDDPIDVQGDIERAVQLVLDGKFVRLNQPDEVATLVTELGKHAAEWKALGKDAPVFNMCQVSVANTNMFCVGNTGTSRDLMPQLKGIPLPGSIAARTGKADARGEVDISQAFKDWLADQGIVTKPDTIQASHLRASQNEMNGAKIAGIMGAMQQGLIPESPIFVTRDHYVIDGHHRYAAKLGLDAMDNHLGDISMPVMVVDMDIGAALHAANVFAAQQGIPQAGAGVFNPADLANPPQAVAVSPAAAALWDSWARRYRRRRKHRRRGYYDREVPV